MGIIKSKSKEEDIQGDPNDLKINLYPSKKPRYEFERSPLKNLIEKDTLGYSFDKSKKLAYVNSGTPVLDGFYIAHSNHYPIRINPDHIWLLIVQAFSNHVNANAESLRHYFVNFEGKKQLIVNYPLNRIEEVSKKDLESFSEQINEQMKKYLGEEIVNILTPDYTTTDYDSTIVCKISIMGAFKKYFKYEMHLCGCGIPYIILEGTSEDYEKIISKAKKLAQYNFGWYINRVIPHIKKMAEAKNGNIDVGYFKKMIENKTEKEWVSGLSGRGGHNIKVEAIQGWILDFFAYYAEVERSGRVERFMEKSIKIKDFDKLAQQMLNVPFLIVGQNKSHNMKYRVGFIGCDQNNKKEVFPVTGWIVCPETEADKDSIL